MPPLLIDLEFDLKHTNRIRIVSGLNVNGPYVALSYRWGQVEQIKTETGNIDSLMQGFLVEILPRTLQDAINVTRALGIRYFWVDTLCILQDNQRLKTIAIDNMGVVYKNATITIIAASANSAAEGFLHERPLSDMNSCQLPFLISEGSFGSVIIAKTDYYIPKDPARERGWTFQEELLSPRLLIFSERELLWRCQQTGYLQVNESHLHFLSELELLPPSFFHNQVAAGGVTVKQQQKLWGKIIEQYSQRTLKYPEDRLAAIAGISRELSIAWRDDYVAGLWRNCLIPHLAWELPSGDEKPTLTEEYLAPSWSWISIVSRVHIRPLRLTIAELLHYHVELTFAAAPFGPLKNGALTIKTKAFDVPLIDRAQSHLPGWVLTYDSEGSSGGITLALLGFGPRKSLEGKNRPIALILKLVEGLTYQRIGLAYHVAGNDWEEVGERVIRII